MSARTRLVLSAVVALVLFSTPWLAESLAQGRGQQGQTGQGGQGGQAVRGAGGGGRGGGQGQTRDAAATPQVGTGLILGQVVTSDTGAAVRRARVSLSGADLRGARTATTDDEGRFVFTQLPAGRYTMSAVKNGYVSIAYGAKAPGRAGTPIQLTDGQKLETKAILLPKGGVVTGVVHDEYGEPSPGTPVRAMRIVMRTGEKRLEQAGTDTTDDRGMYRIYGLQPGQYIVSAQPRNTGLAGITTSIAAEIENAMQQVQTMMGAGGRGGGAAGGGRGMQLGDLLQGMGGGRGGGQLLDQLQQLNPEGQTQTAYAPVFFPGTTSPSGANPVEISTGQERFGVDFQLQLVNTATVSGVLGVPEGMTPSNAQITLAPVDTLPGLPGATQTARAGQDGQFTFRNVAPGQYRVSARAQVRDAEAVAAAQAQAQQQGAQGGRGGRGGLQDLLGGRGGRGNAIPSETLWALADVTVNGQDQTGVSLQLQPGMTVSGQLAFDRTSLTPPTDLTRARVTIATVGTQDAEFGGLPAATVDANGRFSIAGVPPGRYALRATIPAGGQAVPGQGAQTPGAAGSWQLRSSVVGGRDTLDFPLEIGPNMNVGDAVITFGDRTTELTGMLTDGAGAPTSDYTIIVFTTDTQYWTPQSRRIQSARPGTDGKFTVRNLPPGNYAIAAVTDVEPGEWFNPDFLQELQGASMRFSLAEGDKKVQNLRLSSGIP
jgi:uncharacterized protein (DUF2141 family)